MTPSLLLENAIRPALRLLPSAMRSTEAEGMLLSIALQESKAQHRRQVSGPARGYWQFEWIGVSEVLRNEASSSYAVDLCEALDVEPHAGTVHAALEYHDILAAGFARLFLWPVPSRLSTRSESARAWQQYLRRWAPGKPHPETWPDHYQHAWAVVADAQA